MQTSTRLISADPFLTVNTAKSGSPLVTSEVSTDVQPFRSLSHISLPDHIITFARDGSEDYGCQVYE